MWKSFYETKDFEQTEQIVYRVGDNHGQLNFRCGINN